MSQRKEHLNLVIVQMESRSYIHLMGQQFQGLIPTIWVAANTSHAQANLVYNLGQHVLPMIFFLRVNFSLHALFAFSDVGFFFPFSVSFSHTISSSFFSFDRFFFFLAHQCCASLQMKSPLISQTSILNSLVHNNLIFIYLFYNLSIYLLQYISATHKFGFQICH